MPQTEYNIDTVMFLLSTANKGLLKFCIHIWFFWARQIILIFGHFWEAEWNLYSYLFFFGKPNNICIWSFLGNQMIFVIVFAHIHLIIFIFVFSHQNTIRSPLALHPCQPIFLFVVLHLASTILTKRGVELGFFSISNGTALLYSRFPCCVLLVLSWNTTNENPSAEKLSRAIN